MSTFLYLTCVSEIRFCCKLQQFCCPYYSSLIKDEKGLYSVLQICSRKLLNLPDWLDHDANNHLS
jgi:hypothetical protein